MFRVSAAPQRPVAAECQTTFTDVPLQPQSPVETWLAPTIRACARRQSDPATGAAQFRLQIINAGPAVWVVDRIPGWNQQAMNSGSFAVTFFRAATAGRYQGLAVEPEQHAFANVPLTFTLHLAPNVALQAEWETISRLTAAAQARLKTAVLSLLSPTGTAVLACGRAAYGVGTTLGNFQSTTTGSDVLDSLYTNVGAAVGCSTAIDKARAAARAANEEPAVAAADLAVHDAGVAEHVELSGFTLIAAKVENALGLAVDLLKVK